METNTKPSYTLSHLSRGKGACYDQDLMASPWLRYLWAKERRLLIDLLRGERAAGRTPGLYLDFACGTARVLSALESKFNRAIGVDVSEEMLAVARTKVTVAELRLGNVLDEPSLVSEQFDFVTAFRFFPNAEPWLREQIATFLSGVVAPGGLLVANNHQNAESALCVLAKLARKEWPWSPMRNEELVSVLEKVGFALAGRLGVGFAPATARRMLIPAWAHSGIDRFGRLLRADMLAQDVIMWFRRL